MSALVEIKDVCKVYNPGENEVRALDHVSLTIDEQEFVAIIGHSGSGKSTLMNMLAGIYFPDEGKILVNGEPTTIASPKDAFACGIGMIHQHLKLVDGSPKRKTSSWDWTESASWI